MSDSTKAVKSETQDSDAGSHRQSSEHSHRRKQTNPHKVTPGPSLVINVSDNSDSDVLVIDDGAFDDPLRLNSSNMAKKDSIEMKPNDAKVKVTEKKVGSPAKRRNSKESGPARVGRPPKDKSKNPTSTSQSKFEEVEQAMEVMFAGIKDEPGSKDDNTPKKLTETSKDNSQNISVPKKRGRKKKEESQCTPKLNKQQNTSHSPCNNQYQISKSINSSPQTISKNTDGNVQGIDEIAHRRRVESLGRPSSAMSPAYDSKRPDETWLCVFCKQTTHFNGMGDLFGPYFVKTSLLEKKIQLTSPNKKPEPSGLKFILGASGGDGRKKRKRKVSEVWGAAKDEQEVWFHEDCVCWLPQISLHGHILTGLEAAISGAENVQCSKCNVPGATLVCLRNGCRDKVHYPCALKAAWLINSDSMEAFCESHANET